MASPSPSIKNFLRSRVGGVPFVERRRNKRVDLYRWIMTIKVILFEAFSAVMIIIGLLEDIVIPIFLGESPTTYPKTRVGQFLLRRKRKGRNVRESRYAVIQTSIWDSELQVHVLIEDFSDIKKAEKAREEYLKLSDRLDPQKIKVLQYAI